MSSPSPPKPWERAGGASAAIPTSQSVTTAPAPISTATSSDPPELPSRPDTLNSVVNRTASNYGPYANR
ncbi:hypothetical protein LTR28_000944, partial [Elasticomyces elasticus]